MTESLDEYEARLTKKTQRREKVISAILIAGSVILIIAVFIFEIIREIKIWE